MKRLWTEDSVDMVGSHFELKGASVPTKPIQKPHPPIWIGANADPAIRRITSYNVCYTKLLRGNVQLYLTDVGRILRRMGAHIVGWGAGVKGPQGTQCEASVEVP